jgi:hypothetical protein
MTLEEASAAPLDAVQAGDLDALSRALDARGEALSAGQTPTAGVHAAGELTLQLLRELIRVAGLEIAWLSRIGLATQSGVDRSTQVDLAG